MEEAGEVGVSEWRCRAASWVAGRANLAPKSGLGGSVVGPVDYLSLTELMWLGKPEASPVELDRWGVAARAIDGSLLLRMPRGHPWEDFQGPRGSGVMPAQLAEVHLLVAEMLATLEMPASLAPGIASYVVWDVLTAAEMAHPDDWFALVRATRTLPKDRTFDYISTLTATGPLIPAK